MVYVCVIPGCKHRRNKTIERSFHSFPFSDPERLEKWISAVSRETDKGTQWRPTNYSRICSDHFTDNDYEEGTKIKTLKASAVPTQFPTYPSHKQPVVKTPRAPPKLRLPVKRKESQDNCVSPAKIIRHDHTYCISSVEEDLNKTKVALAEKSAKLLEKQKEVKLLKRKIKRKDNKLSALLENLKKDKVLSSDQIDLLNLNFDKDTITLIENELKASSSKSKGLRYSEKLKDFAVTMHFYSAQAYNYLRQYLSLPHPATIRKWASSRNCQPGFLSEVFATLKNSVTQNRKDVVLMFDAMAIKKAYQFDPGSKTYYGSVNYGHIQTGCEETLASEALVFMIVGLKQHFKQVIGYFLIDKINAQTQAQLVKDAISLIVETGHSVKAVVCDGNFSNQSTATHLGCNFDVKNMTTSFEHEDTDESIYFLFDACHLLKNVRNCFREWSILKYNFSEIKWQFVKELHDLQCKDNLVLANKLKGKHINCENNKMNVKLAAQVLSSSVAQAIDFANEDLQLPQFLNSEATTKFIRTFDKIFDICNSSNPLCKGSKSAITKTNISSKVQFINEAIKYIEGLTDSQGKPLVFSRRKTGFIGFICTLKSLIELTERLFASEHYRFFLTYRLSQDHLETFFSRVRRKSGWNNNPTALQFKWTLRMLLMKNHVLPSKHANCIELECNNKLFPNNYVFDEDEDASNTETIDSVTLPSHLVKFVQLLQSPSVYHNHVLHYISGFICRKLSKLSKCNSCKNILIKRNIEQADSSDALFTRRRDNGGLIYSQDMHKVVVAADHALRTLLTDQRGPVKSVDKLLDLKVYQNVLQKVGLEVFQEVWSHSIDCHPIESEDSHATQIIRGAVKIFCKMMLLHHEQLLNDRFINCDQGSKRHKLTKTVLFLHQ